MRALVAFMVAVAVLFGGSSVAAEPRPIHEDIVPYSLEAVAEDVLLGNFGNGTDRVARLTEFGLTADEVERVQEMVDVMVPVVVRTVGTGTQGAPRAPGGGSWQGSRPAYYGGGTGCSQYMADVVANAMWARGASNNAVTNMLAIISRESGCNSAAFNGNTSTGDQSYGLCQINALAGFFRPGQILSGYSPSAFAGNPEHNAAACAALWARCGFHPWQKGNYGCHRP